MSVRQGVVPKRVAKSGSCLPVRCQSERLLNLPGKGPMPSASPKTPVRNPQHISPRGALGAGTQRNRRVPPGENPPQHHCGRILRFPGSVGMGCVSPAGIVESGLRRVNGDTGPQRPEDDTETGPRGRSHWSGSPAADHAESVEGDIAEAVRDSTAPSRCFFQPIRLASHPAPTLQ